MNLFENERIETGNFNVKNLKHEVPFTVVKPININKDSKVIIVMGGLNGDRAWLKYFNHKVFDSNFLISFDQKGQAQNKEKPSQFYSRLINYNLKVLEYITKTSEYKGLDVILIGESWGANCCLLMSKKRPDLMRGFFIWNMPGKLPTRNPEVPNKKLICISTKTIFTFLTGINTKEIMPFDVRLTSNKLLIRASRYQNQTYANSKISIAIYFSFRPSWKIIRKNNLKVPFIYIQSMEDIMLDKKRFSTIKNNKNVLVFEKGRHILWLEDNSNFLGDEIEKFVMSL